mmetsp:Transcript_25941/g.38848  ORF Transcript_25941/g.38848 Transcript_25941/m.38848 type:complete len:486 (+) Transcript_25941:130-1587(+)
MKYHCRRIGMHLLKRKMSPKAATKEATPAPASPRDHDEDRDHKHKHNHNKNHDENLDQHNVGDNNNDNNPILYNLAVAPSLSLDSSSKPTSDVEEGQEEKEERLSPNTVKAVLNNLEREAENRVKDGFNRWNFTFGVANTHFVVYMWAVYPEHFWILYIIEGAFFLSFRFYKLWNKRPLNQALHYLDFCWVTSIACYIFLSIVLFVGGPGNELFSPTFRRQFLELTFGVACGPLLGTLLVTPLSLVFHSNETMASVFLHFFPAMQLYILRWNSSVMREVWPVFWYENFDFLNFWPREGLPGSVLGNSLIYYFCWAVPYMIFQLVIGLDLPRTHRKMKTKEGIPKQPFYDTVYHFNMREGQCVWMGEVLWKRPKEESLRMVETNEFELRDFFAYMTLHFISVVASVVLLAWFCSLSKYSHAAWIYAIFGLVILRGANRYVYYSTQMYTSIVRRQFVSLLGHGAIGSGNDLDVNHIEGDWTYSRLNR